jgi:hypothetical protein
LLSSRRTSASVKTLGLVAAGQHLGVGRLGLLHAGLAHVDVGDVTTKLCVIT